MGYFSPFTLLWVCSVVTYYTHWSISVSPRKHFCSHNHHTVEFGVGSGVQSWCHVYTELCLRSYHLAVHLWACHLSYLILDVLMFTTRSCNTSCLVEQIEQEGIIHCLQMKNPSSWKVGTRSGIVNASQLQTTEMWYQLGSLAHRTLDVIITTTAVELCLHWASFQNTRTGSVWITA